MQDVNTAATAQFTEDDIEELLDSIDEDESAAPLLPAKRKRDEDERENKSEAPAAKRMKETSPSRSNPSPLSTSAHATTVNTAAPSSRATGKVAKPGKRIPVPGKKPKILRAVQLEIRDSLRSGGQSGSARHDRTVAILIKAGCFRGNAKRLEKLRQECMHGGGDPNPGLDINNPKQVACSRCGTIIQLKSVYQAKRFRDHWDKGTCKKPPRANTSITGYFSSGPKPVASSGPTQSRIAARKDLVILCPGLTGAIHPRIDYYIENCPAMGAGAKDINHYVQNLFESTRGITSIRDSRLTQEEWSQAYQCQNLDRRWRIDTSPHHPSVFSTSCFHEITLHSQADIGDPTIVCGACYEVYQLREFRTAINRSREKPHDKLKYTPNIHANPIQSRLMARYKGLEEIFNEVSSHSFGPSPAWY
jgi:hypothetical protein